MFTETTEFFFCTPVKKKRKERKDEEKSRKSLPEATPEKKNYSLIKKKKRKNIFLVSHVFLFKNIMKCSKRERAKTSPDEAGRCEEKKNSW